jgi:sterol desaturase/sphingolipid hydroxylase (fatty acid hydroxylase superfamily)
MKSELMQAWDIIRNAYANYANYLWHEITHPHWGNYFYWLIGVSAIFFVIEVFKPWRKGQPVFRKDFWLDLFYMFFNFFLFSLIIYNAASDVVVHYFNNVLQFILGIDLQASNPLNNWPMWAILLTGFVIRDFVQWNVHRLLHWSPRLWEFHKVHHSVEEMGFAAHLRFHWMENVVYRSIEYIPLALLGIGLYDFFIIHIATLAIGHYNHSNVTVSARWSGAIVGFLTGFLMFFNLAGFEFLLDASLALKALVWGSTTLIGFFILGPYMKLLFNSPEMHIWHHAYDVPETHKYGINFGISLAIWDYLFGTAVIPHEGRDIRLGFEGIEEFPKTFKDQIGHGFRKPKKVKDN